jgi:hypothetical protein
MILDQFKDLCKEVEEEDKNRIFLIEKESEIFLKKLMMSFLIVRSHKFKLIPRNLEAKVSDLIICNKNLTFNSRFLINNIYLVLI